MRKSFPTCAFFSLPVAVVGSCMTEGLVESCILRGASCLNAGFGELIQFVVYP